MRTGKTEGQNMNMIKKRIIIKGRKVHNIGYRFFLYDEALRLGLPYFDARNIKDELEVINIHVGGEEEKIKRLTAYAKNNFPPLAEVTGVTEEHYTRDIRDIELFERSFMLEQQSKATSYGLDILTTLKSMDRTMTGMDEKQNKTLEKQDKMLTGQDKMLEKQDMMLAGQDKMLQKQDMMLAGQDKMLETQDKMLEKQDKMLEKQDLHIEISQEILRETKQGFESITHELKGFKELHEEIRELRQEVNELKGTVARIEKKVAA